MEQVVVAGVTSAPEQAKLTLVGVPDRPGVAARIFKPLSDASINVDMIIQNASAEGRTDLTFTVDRGDASKAARLLSEHCGELFPADHIRVDENIAKVSVVGVGMR